MEFLSEKKAKELAWARIHDPIGIVQLIDKNTGEVVHESYRPSIAKLNKEISFFFRK